jgi:hypothetical protein
LRDRKTIHESVSVKGETGKPKRACMSSALRAEGM